MKTALHVFEQGFGESTLCVDVENELLYSIKSNQFMVMSVQIMFNSINSKNCFKVVRWEMGCFGHVLACPSPFGNHRNMRDTKTQLVFCTVSFSSAFFKSLRIILS